MHDKAVLETGDKCVFRRKSALSAHTRERGAEPTIRLRAWVLACPKTSRERSSSAYLFLYTSSVLNMPTFFTGAFFSHLAMIGFALSKPIEPV